MIEVQVPMPEFSKHAVASPGWLDSVPMAHHRLFVSRLFPLSVLVVIGWFVLKWMVKTFAVHAHQAVAAKQDQRDGQAMRRP